MRSFSCFKPRDPFKNWSKELDRRVAVWAKNFDSCFKLLLLGPAGVGKTTIMKQMKIIHFEGFSLEERQQKAKEIRTNLLESVRELTACITASGHQIDWCDKENQARLDFINGLNLDDQTYDVYAAKIYDYSKRILTDKGVEDLFAQLNQLSITHRSQYLLNRVDEIRNVNYIPNNDDILQSRRRTSDIQKLEFQVNLPVCVDETQQQQRQGAAANQQGPTMKQTFCMFDVGGQRGERRKWIQVFDGVSAVMFLIDSSSFDAIDDENGKNKLKETISLFHEVWTTRFLLNSNFVLLFNKQDILKEKIERGHRIEDHFPEYRLYKFQASERHLSEKGSHKSEHRLSLFRTISSTSASFSPRSLRHNQNSASVSSSSSGARRSSPTRASFVGSKQSDGGGALQQLAPNRTNPLNGKQTTTTTDNNNTTQTSATVMTPIKQRKTSSLYRFGRSRSFFRAKSPVKPSSNEATVLQQQKEQQQQQPETVGAAVQPEPLANSPRSNVPTAASAAAANKRTTTTNDINKKLDSVAANMTKEQRDQLNRDTHLAYIKARSFIRDKFLQITRQVDTHHHHDQRKFSSPNLPIYNQKAAPPSGAQINQPKRNVCYHYTTATDTENIRDLFENLQKMVIKSTMKDL